MTDLVNMPPKERINHTVDHSDFLDSTIADPPTDKLVEVLYGGKIVEARWVQTDGDSGAAGIGGYWYSYKWGELSGCRYYRDSLQHDSLPPKEVTEADVKKAAAILESNTRIGLRDSIDWQDWLMVVEWLFCRERQLASTTEKLTKQTELIALVEESKDNLIRTQQEQIEKLSAEKESLNEVLKEYMRADMRAEQAHLCQRPGHDLRYALDGSKMRGLGWTPPLSFEESLAKTVQWTIDPENKRWINL